MVRAIKARLAELESRRLTLEADLAARAEPALRLHPNLAVLYRQRIADLAQNVARQSR